VHPRFAGDKYASGGGGAGAPPGGYGGGLGGGIWGNGGGTDGGGGGGDGGDGGGRGGDCWKQIVQPVSTSISQFECQLKVVPAVTSRLLGPVVPEYRLLSMVM